MLDVETAPHMAAVWGLYDQNIAISQLLQPGYTLCWAAKWYGEKEILFDSILSGKRKMVRGVYQLLQDADAVCHYNGTKFDIPTLNKEFLTHELTPPAPYKQVDLLKVARTQFKLASNKLDFVAKHLGLGAKLEHKGFELWLECMAKKADAWRTMEKYNKQDVVLLEKVYERLKPWIKNHPNHSVFGGYPCCPNCGSQNTASRGYQVNKSMRYQRFQCQDCGSWSRKPQAEKGAEKMLPA